MENRVCLDIFLGFEDCVQDCEVRVVEKLRKKFESTVMVSSKKNRFTRLRRWGPLMIDLENYKSSDE